MAAHVMRAAGKWDPNPDHRSSSSLVATMAAETNPEEEAKNKEMLLQEEEDDGEEEPGVTPGAGRFLDLDIYCSFLTGFRKQTAQRRRRKRKSPRRRRQHNLTPQGLDFRNFS